MKEKCATHEEALASITSLDELRGYIWGLKEFGGGAHLTKEQWAEMARRKAEWEKRWTPRT